MDIIIGSARISEHGTISGTAGDQDQKKTPDYSGEVSLEAFYVDSDGWVVMRPKSARVASNIAANMYLACNNINIGYSQYERAGVLKNGLDTDVPTNADCSSLVRACVKAASGIDPGNFTTSGEVKALTATELFEKPFQYMRGMALCPGDVLITGRLPYGSKGHTAIVVIGEKRPSDDTVHATYAVRLAGEKNYLPAVTDLTDYAGIIRHPVSGVYITVSLGSIGYRLHKIGGYWTRYYFDGEKCEIDGSADCIEVYYYTPEDYANEHGYLYAKYRVSPSGSDGYYDWQYDDEKDSTIDMDGYAGAFCVPFDKFQLEITGEH